MYERKPGKESNFIRRVPGSYLALIVFGLPLLFGSSPTCSAQRARGETDAAIAAAEATNDCVGPKIEAPFSLNKKPLTLLDLDMIPVPPPVANNEPSLGKHVDA
jgi:hypothetical protein